MDRNLFVVDPPGISRNAVGVRKRRWRQGLALAVTAAAVCFTTALASPPAVAQTGGASAALGPAGITSGPDGALWFTNFRADNIGRITTAGKISYYSGPGISGPFSITVGPDGALWFTNLTGGSGRNGSIGRITTSGVVTNYTSPSIDYPQTITTGPDGALWFTNTLGAVDRMSTAGAVTVFHHAGMTHPYGITTGPDGNLWVTNPTGSLHKTEYGAVIRLTPSGKFTFFREPGMYRPRDITTLNGDLWFVNFMDASIGSVTTAGDVTNYPRPQSPLVSDLIAVTSGPNGQVWFVSDGADGGYAGEVSSSGNYTVFSLPANALPEGITTGPDGALWFTDPGNSAIGRITTSGQITEYP